MKRKVNKLIRYDFKRIFIILFLVLLVQFATDWLLMKLGIGGLVAIAIVCFVTSFVFMLLQVPSHLRKYALKTQSFHYNVLGYFFILLLLSVIRAFL